MSLRLCSLVILRRAFCGDAVSALRSRKPKSTRDAMKHFVDRMRVRAVGGSGGDGCVSLLSAWANENAGPDGGDGGNGGHVILNATPDVNNLNHCSTVLAGENGEKGYNKDCDGKSGKHSIIKVPIGTVVRDQIGKIIADLDVDGKMFLAARGGAGGRGNKFFATDINQAPEIAEYGATGETKYYTLEVKSMAHVGLIGFPNAGKSTLLQAVTRSRTRIAPHPFTTLLPHIGMILYQDYVQIAVADLPGLIPGSHKNYGLGIQFLQHAERCCCLVLVIDASEPKPWRQVESLNYEMAQFNKQLVERPQLIIANKIDLPDAERNVQLLKNRFKKMEVIPVSAKNGTNLTVLLQALRKIYDERPGGEADR